MDKVLREAQSINRSIKAVALYEVIKGFGAIIAAFTLWAWHSHLLNWIDAGKSFWLMQYGSLFNTQVNAIIRVAQKATENWQLFLLIIAGYAILRFIEAYGLWQDKAWAYWLSLLGYGLFIPSELYYFIMRPFDAVKLFIVLLNIAVVIIVYRQMRHRKLL